MSGSKRSPAGKFLKKTIQGWGKLAKMAVCGACGQVFPNRLQVGAHSRTCRAIRHVLQPPITDPDMDVEDIPGITLHSLARRPAHPWAIESDVDMTDLPAGNSPFTRDYRPVIKPLHKNYKFSYNLLVLLRRCSKCGAPMCKIVSIAVIPNSGFYSQLYRMKVPLAATEFLPKSKT